MFCFLYQHFAWSVRTVLIHNTEVAPRLQLLTTQEQSHCRKEQCTGCQRALGCLRKTQVAPQLSVWGCLYRLYLSQDSGGISFWRWAPSPRKETGVQLGLKIQCVPGSARMQDWIMPWTTFPLTADQTVHIHGKVSPWFIRSLNVYLNV